MKVGFKFWVSDLWQNKLENLFSFIQIAVSFLILCYVFSSFLEYREIQQKFAPFMKRENVYKLEDLTDERKYEATLNDKKASAYFETMVQLVDKIDETKVFIDSSHFSVFQKESIPVLNVSSNFFEIYDVKGTYHLKQITKIFEKKLTGKEKIIPAVVGADYKKRYKIGDYLENDFGEKYKIYGFFHKGESYALPMESRELLKLDRQIVTPMSIVKDDNSSYLSYLLSCQFFSKNASSIKNILEENSHYNYIDFGIKNYRTQLLKVKNSTIELIALFGTMAVILFLYSVIGILGNIIQHIEESKYEYGVNMLCGASFRDVFSRVMYHIIFLIGIAGITPIFIWKWCMAVELVILLAVVCIMLSCTYLYITMKKMNIVLTMRRGQG